MCEVCAIFALGEHWTDAGRPVDVRHPAQDIQLYRRERRYRLALVNHVLDGSGVSCIDWDGEAFAVLDAQGRQKIVPSLAEIWREAEKFAGRRFDPLDPALLQALSREARA
jgi:hypothetical protein